MAGGNVQSLACGCSPGPLWLKAKGIKEVFDSQRSHIRTFVHPNPITFPGIYAPEGLFSCPGGPKNVARKVTAAGTAGKQKWSLILPSSARVSELTYVTIIGARYPELDTVQNDIIQFGNYLQAEQCTRGGFLPILWDAPYSYINASIDIGEVVDWITDKFVVANKGDLAVLHNRNKMVNAFANTEWVSGSGGAIISRSVTSCAGMTAYLVLVP